MSRYVAENGAVDARFARLMVGLGETLGVKVDESRHRAYAKLLGDVEWSDLCAAFGRAGRERASGFFPSPGELRRYVAPTEDDAAVLAWMGFSQAASRAGAYGSLEVEDGAAAEALSVVFGSWPAFCGSSEGPELATRRQEFMAAYRNARRRNAKPKRLAGLCEQSDARGALSPAVWIARLALDGSVIHERGHKELSGGHEQARLSEGADAQAAQSQAPQA